MATPELHGKFLTPCLEVPNECCLLIFHPSAGLKAQFCFIHNTYAVLDKYTSLAHYSGSDSSGDASPLVAVCQCLETLLVVTTEWEGATGI